ncbi:314_t:CDS:2 [Paraglomus occultum]|uniref:polynucleotide adenylyltransferase n=1 Tax=Paraglomus occultum TaxID=144539 RepID=A0A9N8ZDU4_9GLOM|nr:314_t:CDS:2 [Paraglomus occultum]
MDLFSFEACQTPYKKENNGLMKNTQDLFKDNNGFIPFDDSKNPQVNTNSRKRKRAELEVITVLTDEDYPWISKNYDLNQFDHATELLNQELRDFVDYIMPTMEEKRMRKFIIKRIENVCAELWKESMVYAFGSFDTRLYLPTSDIDLVCFCSAYNAYKPDSTLNRLSKRLRNQDICQGPPQSIARAKVPIIKCQERHSGISIDISFNNISGLESARVVKEYLNTIPALKELTIVIKHFLKLKNLHDAAFGGLGSYSIVIMLHPLIQKGYIKPEKNLGVLLIEFFEFYGNQFNFRDLVVSIRDGGRYYQKRDCLWTSLNFAQICLEDPAKPDNDVARATRNWYDIRKEFGLAYLDLTEKVAYVQKTYFDEKGKKKVSDDDFPLSILKSILHVPAEIRSSRERLHEAYSNGELQGALGVTQDEDFTDEFSETTLRTKEELIKHSFIEEIREVDNRLSNNYSNFRNKRSSGRDFDFLDLVGSTSRNNKRHKKNGSNNKYDMQHPPFVALSSEEENNSGFW